MDLDAAIARLRAAVVTVELSGDPKELDAAMSRLSEDTWSTERNRRTQMDNRRNFDAQTNWDYVMAIDKLVPEAERYADSLGLVGGNWTRAFHQQMAILAEKASLRKNTLHTRLNAPIAVITTAGQHNRKPIP